MAEFDFDRSDLQQVVALINGKGGVGKTTITTNSGGLLAADGWRVLAVDLDPQGNVGLDLGYADTEQDDDGKELSKALVYGDAPRPLKNVRPGLDVLPGGHHLEGAAATLASKIGKGGRAAAEGKMALAIALSHISADYDIILIDCPPNIDVLQTVAVAAARYVLIPTKTDAASKKGLILTANRLDQVLDLNPELDLLGIVLFGTSQSAKRVRKEYVDEVNEVLGVTNADGIVFQSFISHSEATAKQTRNKGLLAHEVDDAVRTAPKWYESLKRGEKIASPGPVSAQSVADSLQAVTQELVARFTERAQAAEGEQETADV
ncbi:ParA family protein [Leifsonia sp. NPDC058194]|uniref:ParA family protein n=1 Tax=Leifsonia sp. NPDC058194 TaxID=3346374 RepID=UPI0036DA8DE3